MKDFEQYLQEKHYELFPQLLDDDLPDAFDGWVGGLDGNDIMEYAEKCVAELNEKLEKALKLGGEAIEELQKIRDIAERVELKEMGDALSKVK